MLLPFQPVSIYKHSHSPAQSVARYDKLTAVVILYLTTLIRICNSLDVSELTGATENHSEKKPISLWNGNWLVAGVFWVRRNSAPLIVQGYGTYLTIPG
jgi:hypothetical protein